MARKKIKKAQRHVNSIVEKANKAIAKDELWKGRFVVRQKKVLLEYEFQDHSGAEIFFELEFTDKQTGITSISTYNNYDLYYRLFTDLNDFIVEKVKVWEENPNPNRKTSIDYRKRW